MSARLAWLLCGLLAAGSAGAQVEKDCVPLSGFDAVKLRGIRVLSAIPQEDVQKATLPYIRTQVQVVGPPPSSSSILGAIIGVAIGDAIVNSQIQKRVERASLAFPGLLEAVGDFDFRRQFWSRLDEEMAREGRFKVLELVTFDGERGHLEQPQSVRGEPLDAVLDLRTEYFLSADLRAFVMRTDAVLHAAGDQREMYRCRYHFATPPVAAEELEPALAAWAADGGALYRAAAVIGMVQTLKMLRFDLTGLEAPRPAGGPAQVTETVQARGVLVRQPIPGGVVEREDGAVIVRDPKGAMRAALEGDTFAPSAEAIAAAAAAPGAGRRSAAGPVMLDDLLGMIGETLVPAPEVTTAKEAPPPREGGARAAALDELDALLGN